MSKFESIREDLLSRMSNMKVIDTHDHLTPESAHLKMKFNFFHLFIPYVQFDLMSAGMPGEWLWRAPEKDEDIDRYWKAISPLWKYVKHGSYARPVIMALKEFWDVDDIDDGNYREIGDKLNVSNKPGLYGRIFTDRCKVEWILNQSEVA